jgi:predicted N-acetyltransferase YhbS
MIQIFSTADKKISTKEIKKLHEIMRIAYEVTEEEIWGKNYTRLFIEDFSQLIEKGNMHIAYLNNEIVGSVHVYRKDENTYSFGLLSVDFSVGGKGIGSALISRAEEIAIKNNATSIKIEILRVKGVDVPHKIRLADYYRRLGYTHVGSEDCACIIPESKCKLLIAPSDFDFYSKKL